MISDSIIKVIKARSLAGLCDGRQNTRNAAYMELCAHFHGHSGSLILFSRDEGHHTSGWMKNPDFERCWHLSLSFRRPFPQWPEDRLASPYAIARLGAVVDLAPFDWNLARQWVEAILGADAKLAWTESPKSPEGIELGVMHWRVFVDDGWQAIKPRGETYSKQFTDAGWQSWSDLNIERPSHVDAD